MAATTKAVKTIAQALLKAQMSIDSVTKDAFNSHQRYRYASSEAIIRDSRHALAEAGLLVYADKWRIVPTEGLQAAAMLEVTFALEHAETGDTRPHEVQFPVHEGKGRPLDKGAAAALTLATSYFLRGLLNLPRVDEADEVNQRDDRDHGTKSNGRGKALLPPPAKKQKMSRNRAEADCVACGQQVPAGGGWQRQDGDETRTIHDECYRAKQEAA